MRNGFSLALELLDPSAFKEDFVSDNGTDLTSKLILQWANDHKVARHYIDRGKSVQNAFA
jgi:hypothetical protein